MSRSCARPRSHSTEPAPAPPAGFAHTPVLLAEVLARLEPRPGDRFIDGTLGGGGHAEAILTATAPDGRLLGLDQDPAAIAAASARLARFGERARLVNVNFRELATVAPAEGFAELDGILLDLGVSSHQLDAPERGFSFRYDAPLDMRLGPAVAQTAADLVNTLDERALADLLYTYGEETRSRAIARLIVRERERAPIERTGQLADLVARAVGGRPGRIHPATRTFQALRIAVNEELAALERALAAAVPLLRPGGRLVVISFHSLEDRIVKQFMARAAHPCVCPPGLPACVCGRVATLRLVTKKPVVATDQERDNNPRSRSAKLRVAAKVC